MRKTATNSLTANEPPDVPEIIDRATLYAQSITAGALVAGPYVRAACARHLKDLRNGEARGLRYHLAAADRAIRFIETRLKLAGGQFEGRPFELHESQAFIIGSLFGWQKYSNDHGQWLRRFRRAYIEIAKGNGKSPLAAAICLYLMVADDEARAEVYAAGANMDQARVLFGDAIAMIDQSPTLRARIMKSGRNPVWQVVCTKGRARGSRFRPISQDRKKSGPRPSCAACDELHEHPSSVVLDMLERGFKWRKQPLLLMITNSGSDPHSVCGREHDLAVKVAEGAIEMDEEFSFVCGLDLEERDADGMITRAADDPLADPSCWIKANPLLGVTTSHEELDREARYASALPGTMNEILRLRFCMWTDADRAWLPRAALERVYRDFDPREIHKGQTIYCGLDLSASQDLTALACVVETGTAQVVREVEGVATPLNLPTFDAWVECWTPRDTLQARELRDKAPYGAWLQAGWLHAPQGEIIRLDHVAARVAAISATYRIGLLAFDRYAFHQFERELADLGITLATVEHPQGGRRRGRAPDEEVSNARSDGIEPDHKDFPKGLWMPESIRELETLVYERRIRLQRNPVLSSAIASVAIEADAFGNRWLSKRRATGRIDPAVSLAMAIGAAARRRYTSPDIAGFLKKPVTFR